MATFIQKPTIIEAAGQPPKSSEEFIGRVDFGVCLLRRKLGDVRVRADIASAAGP